MRVGRPGWPERMGPPHSHAWLLQPAPPGDQGRLTPQCLKGARCTEEQPRASTGASRGLRQSCRPAGPPWDLLCGAQWPWKTLAACRPDHTHGCPPGLPAEEADREAQQAPPLPAAGGGTALSSCSVSPAGRVSQPQPHVTPRAFAEAAHLSQLPSGPQRLQGLQEQARVLAWGDRAGLWRDCVRRGAPP